MVRERFFDNLLVFNDLLLLQLSSLLASLYRSMQSFGRVFFSNLHYGCEFWFLKGQSSHCGSHSSLNRLMWITIDGLKEV